MLIALFEIDNNNKKKKITLIYIENKIIKILSIRSLLLKFLDLLGWFILCNGFAFFCLWFATHTARTCYRTIPLLSLTEIISGSGQSMFSGSSMSKQCNTYKQWSKYGYKYIG